MNWKPNASKIIISILISLFVTWFSLSIIGSSRHGDYGVPFLNYADLRVELQGYGSEIITTFILVSIGFFILTYLIWSLNQKK